MDPEMNFYGLPEQRPGNIFIPCYRVLIFIIIPISLMSLLANLPPLYH